jgi:cell division protein ZipA
MDALRLSLIIVGVIIIAVVYGWSRRELNQGQARPRLRGLFGLFVRKKHHPEESLTLPPARKISPRVRVDAGAQTINLDDIVSFGQFIPDREPATAVPVTDTADNTAADMLYAASSGEQLIISLTIVGQRGRRFTGEAMLHALNQLNIEYGDLRIFHYRLPTTSGAKQAIVSVANIVEPGIFDLDKLRTFDTPGLVIFMRLPGPMEPRAALDVLLEKGRGLADLLQGDLCDESRNVLSAQTIGYLKEKVEAFRFKQKMSQLGLGPKP